jgi:hypothetical protein
VAYRWAHTTELRRALDLTFDVQTTDPALGRFLDHVLGGLPRAERATSTPVRFGLAEVDGADGGAPRFLVRRAHRTVRESHHPSLGFDELFAAVNRAIVRASGASVLLHAGLVAIDDRALLLVGMSGAGKSSLTGMLCHLGARYGTDELTAADPTTGALVGAARPIMLKPSAPRALVDALPPKPAGLERYLDLVRPVAAADLGAPTMSAATNLAAIVFVHYEHGAPPATMAPMARADAVAELVYSCWNRRAQGRRAFDAAVELARRAEVMSLRFSDCSDAAQAICERVRD